MAKVRPVGPSPERAGIAGQDMNSDLAPLIEQMLSELRRIRRLLGRDRLTHEEHLVLARLIPAILGKFGSTFTTAELIGDPVIVALLPAVNGNANRHLGALLARSVGEDLGGVRLEKCGFEHGAAVWSLQQVE
jgi:hypothetical protein